MRVMSCRSLRPAADPGAPSPHPGQHAPGNTRPAIRRVWHLGTAHPISCWPARLLVSGRVAPSPRHQHPWTTSPPPCSAGSTGQSTRTRSSASRASPSSRSARSPPSHSSSRTPRARSCSASKSLPPAPSSLSSSSSRPGPCSPSSRSHFCPCARRRSSSSEGARQAARLRPRQVNKQGTRAHGRAGEPSSRRARVVESSWGGSQAEAASRANKDGGGRQTRREDVSPTWRDGAGYDLYDMRRRL